nr:hypothetical protein [uncultured Draconibacterium sp.]
MKQKMNTYLHPLNLVRMKNSLVSILSLLFLSACLQEGNDAPEPTIDWETYRYERQWTEIGSKTSGSGWEDISDGKNLTFFTDSIDKEIDLPYYGKVVYEPDVNISIQSNTSFYRTDSTFVFYLKSFTMEVDSVALVYELLDSSTMVLTDSTVTPAIQIIYRRAMGYTDKKSTYGFKQD